MEQRRPMSIQAISIVWKQIGQLNINANTKLVLLALADFANEEFWAWPSIDTLSKKTGASRCTVLRALDDLEAINELMIDTNGGPHGVNRYLVLLASKGKITNAPNESERGTKVRQVSIRDRLKAGADLRHNPLLPVLHTQETVQRPSLEQVIEFGNEYAGNPAKDIPAKIPESWAANYYGWRTFTTKCWSANWKEEMIFRFERNWLDGEKRARGQIQQKQPGGEGQKKSGDTWVLKQRLEQLKKRAQEHPANENSSSRWGEASAADQEDYQKLLDEIRKCEEQLME